MRSQVQAFGGPAIITWDDYENGCLSTYAGGHHTDGHLDAFLNDDLRRVMRRNQIEGTARPRLLTPAQGDRETQGGPDSSKCGIVNAECACHAERSEASPFWE